MKLRNTLLCGVAATALGLAAALPTNSSILPSLTTQAHAQVQASVSIGFGTFYDSLSPHGDWVGIEGRNVWVPGDVGADWRPYTVGRWAYTRPHGWTWVSDEPYGWAVYHYGRWGFQRNIGWYWVPDTEWAPAWVTWRGSGDYAAWAPMPPQGLVQVSYDVDPYAIPARYWVAVPTSQFLAPNLFSVAINIGEPRFYDVVRHTRPIGHARVVNNVTVNNYFDVDYIERQTGEQVRVRDIREAREPGEVRLGDDAIEIYAPAVEEEAGAEPQQVRTQEEIAEERGVDMAAEPADEQADQPIELAEDAPELPEEAVNREAAPVTDEDVAEDGEAETPDVAEDGETETPDVAEDGEAETPDVAEDGEAETPDVAEDGEAETPDVAEDGEAETPDMAEDGEAGTPDVAEDGEAGTPDVAEDGESGTPDVAEDGEAGTPDVAEDTDTTTPDVAEDVQEAPDVAEDAETGAPDVAEDVQEAPGVAEEPQAETPDVAEEPQAQSPDVAGEEPTPQVEERAIGEPAAQGQSEGQGQSQGQDQSQGQGQEQPQQSGQGGADEEELPQ